MYAIKSSKWPATIAGILNTFSLCGYLCWSKEMFTLCQSEVWKVCWNVHEVFSPWKSVMDKGIACLLLRWSTQVEKVLNQYAKSFWPITILVCSVLVLVSLLVIHFQLSTNSNFTPRSLLAACMCFCCVSPSLTCLLIVIHYSQKFQNAPRIHSIIHSL